MEAAFLFYTIPQILRSFKTYIKGENKIMLLYVYFTFTPCNDFTFALLKLYI